MTMKQYRLLDTTPTSEAAAFGAPERVVPESIALLAYYLVYSNIQIATLLAPPDIAFDPADAAAAYAAAYTAGREMRKKVDDDDPEFKENIGAKAFSSDDGTVDLLFVKHVGVHLSTAVELMQAS